MTSASPDPDIRITVEPCPSRVRVEFNGVSFADTTRAITLHEPGHPPRHYIPRLDARMDLLTPLGKRTTCPWKGDAVYWSAEGDGGVHKEIAWAYPDPVSELPEIGDRVAFYDEFVDAVYFDDEKQHRPTTKYSQA